MVLQQPLVDRAEVAFGEVAVVHELPAHAGEQVEGLEQAGVADAGALQEGVALQVVLDPGVLALAQPNVQIDVNQLE